jgi:hypothetical protein
MSDPELSIDAALAKAAQVVPIPDPGSFAARVADRVRTQPAQPAQAARPRLARTPGHWPRLGPAAAALAAVATLVATVVPPVRTALADFLGVDGVHISRSPQVSSPPVSPSTSVASTPGPNAVAALHLGQPTTLEGAARVVGFGMRLPTTGAYQHPDAVYVGRPPAGGMASMVYLPGAGRPTVPGHGVAALLSEFRGHLEAGYFQKLAGAGTTVEPVRVGNVAGYWLAGTPHEFFYVNPDGTVDTETVRLATNTLLWSAAGVTYRFESGLSRDMAIAIAASMR